MSTKPKLPEDRTTLGALWAEAVADVDEARETLRRAETREREVWAALEQSRRQTVSDE